MRNHYDTQLRRLFCFISFMMIAAIPSLAEDGSAAWLRYAPVAQPRVALPRNIYTSGKTPTERSAALELQRGLQSMLGGRFNLVDTLPESGKTHGGGIVLRLRAGDGAIDSYTIRSAETRSGRWIYITGSTPEAVLYGAFHLLEEIAAERPVPLAETQTAAVPIRWSDEWDNLDGTIERGYAGASFFFAGGHVLGDLGRASAYARILSSVGINGCNVNNVNADLDLLTPEHIQEFSKLAAAFRPWGVKLALSVDLTSPETVGGLATFDPLDPSVIAWWNQKVAEIYTAIADFAGFTVKADSEGRKGPAQYGRSPADAANVLARALAPHHGVVLYRGFVYNNHLDWRDPKADRARAGVDNFVRFDGQFDSNVIIQIKEGPIDFQAREPVSPLFANLAHTNVAIELQTSQEYTGQQRHMVWLPSMWRWVLDTNLHVDGRDTPVKQILEGRTFPLPSGNTRPGGFISVTNAGDEPNWLHHPMALANLYGFGKLAWNPDQPLDQIIDAWTRLTWGNDRNVVQAIDAMQIDSWKVYEEYTGPNGMGTLTNILGYHFGPGIESAERNGWGQWFRGEKDGVGMDRTANGTGYAQQYPPALAATYESLRTCPDDLLLFFHHVPYDYRLHSGKTLVQSIYDAHYAGARSAGEYAVQWTGLKNHIDSERYEKVLSLFTFQSGHAIVWRDAVDDWFHRMSNIADAQARVGQHPNRFEAETMTRSGYEPADVVPAETASGGKGATCHRISGCSLSLEWSGASGTFDVAVQYFDTWNGASHYKLRVADRVVAEWSASDTLPPAQFDPNPDGQTSTRFTAHGVSLNTGDTVTLIGIPDMRSALNDPSAVKASPGALDSQAREHRDYREYAPVDYLEIGPPGPLTPQQ